MMEFVSGGSGVMEAGIFKPEKDVGKAQFQQELSRWFESRGIIADLRSHLRHLMITALQSAQMGAKPTDGTSPKAQALNLMVAEYLLRHGCHYTLSVFTSEVPTLANFSLDAGSEGGKDRKRSPKNYFQEGEVEEIFNALGLPSAVEELALLKGSYLEKGNEDSLVELFLRMAVEMATKVQIHQHLESYAEAGGERLLSKKWSSKIVDVLMGEKMAPSRMSAVEEAIFRITESETRRAVEEQRRAQLQLLSEREKRIQEYLRKHENEMFYRLMEAEKELKTRKDVIDEELNEREKHLTKMAMEWNEKHEEILRLSKKFHSVENENRSFKKKLKELEEENRSLRTEGETQTRTIHELRGELNSLINKLKEVTDSNAILSERIQALINRESKEVCARQDGANQSSARSSLEIPLLWVKNVGLEPDGSPENLHQVEELRKAEEKATLENESVPQPAPPRWNIIQQQKTVSGDAIPPSEASEDEEDVSLSSSFGDIIHEVQKKLQFLENESNRLNQNYLEYKVKCISVDSDSESSRDSTSQSATNLQNEIRTKETKFCQTNADNTFIKIQKLKETNSERLNFEGSETKKLEVSPIKLVTRTPTKRQLQHRDFFLERRHLVQLLEKQQADELQTRRSTAESFESSSGEETTTSSGKISQASPQVKSFSRPASSRSDERPEIRSKPPAETVRGVSGQGSNPLPKSDADCLALLEKARIKSPPVSSRKPLRQQILLSESEKEEGEEGKTDNLPESVVASPASNGKAGQNRGSDGFW